MKIAKFLKAPILKKTCKQVLLYVVFNSNEEQHLLAKLEEIGQDIIMFYIHLDHYGIIIFVLHPEVVVRRWSLESCF